MKLNSVLFGFMFMITLLGLLMPSLMNVVYIGLAIHALRGPRQTLEAFSILFLILMGNPGFFGGGVKSLRWVVLLAGFIGAGWYVMKHRSPVKMDLSLTLILLFILVMLPVAAITSMIPEISLFKLVSFFIGVYTIFLAFRLTANEKAYWQSWFYTWMVFLVLASLVTLPLGLGFIRNNVGFQGIFNHPQTLGPVSGILGAWFAAYLMFIPGRKSPAVLGLLISCFVLIFLSQARIGLVLLGGGFILAWILSTLSGIRVRVPRFGQQVLALAALVFAFVLVLDFDALTALFQDFIQKRDVGSDLSTAFQNSRGFLIDASMANFYEFPVFGIGFGVPTDWQSGFGQLETFMGIPLGASIEKGFFPSALLEETGIFGALITTAFLTGLLIQIVRSRNFPLLWFFLSAVLLNIGEAVFFSIGGLGLFDWLIFGFCYNQTLPQLVSQLIATEQFIPEYVPKN